MKSSGIRPPLNTNLLRGIIIAIAALIAVVALTSSNLFYIMQRVEQQEVGVRFRSGRIVDVVGPGLYTDAGLYVELKKVPSSAVPFTVEDDEIITQDKQRLGLVVAGDIFRPNLSQADIMKANWAQYSELYLQESILQNRVEGLARQAMKVCIGERTFNDNVIGTARDVLRECIDEELQPAGRELRPANLECGRAQYHPVCRSSISTGRDHPEPAQYGEGRTGPPEGRG